MVLPRPLGLCWFVSDESPAPAMAQSSADSGEVSGEDPREGSLEVFIDRAREILNICIYHRQDVYAKLSLSGDPEGVVSTKTVNGAGRNPIFEETLILKVRSLDCSLRCEIWMMSRLKNYLQDQILGFAVVPLAEIAAAADGKLTGEFSLSSSDLLHSPSGFVRLSLSLHFAGPLPPAAPPPSSAQTPPSPPNPAAWKLDGVELSDLGAEKENQELVSELLLAAEVSRLPAIEIHVEKEEMDVRRDIVEMYTKSMSQFTESLAKMKLPMEVNGGGEGSVKSTKGSKKESSPKVFYGSRAFF